MWSIRWARVERGVRHLKDELHLLQLRAGAVAEAGPEPVSIEQHLALAGRQQTRHDARERGLAAPRFTDDADRVAAQDGHVDVAEHLDRRVAPAVAGTDFLDFERG